MFFAHIGKMFNLRSKWRQDTEACGRAYAERAIEGGALEEHGLKKFERHLIEAPRELCSHSAKVVPAAFHPPSTSCLCPASNDVRSPAVVALYFYSFRHLSLELNRLLLALDISCCLSGLSAGSEGQNGFGQLAMTTVRQARPRMQQCLTWEEERAWRAWSRIQ
ncbi:hypothetical protein BKA70DRAFT_1403893 [Coprinopsis sp. MPI-PUGE-AT-0042]|nr:hypothetical protein BKA70DRAFT_1403893 [Coprinopsis sp. MPI-PUGE-AT-0042]